MSALGLGLEILLSVAFTAGAVRWDMGRLPPERYLRSWNTASFWSAVVAFGPLCIPVHFARTRRTVLGFGLGLLWMAGVLVALSIVSAVAGWD